MGTVSTTSMLTSPAARHFYKTVLKIGVRQSARLASSLTTIIPTIYLGYELAKATYDFASGYTAQFHELEGGEKFVGTNSKEIGELFDSKSPSGNSWDILGKQFDAKNIKDVERILELIANYVENPRVNQWAMAQVMTKILINKNSEFLLEGQTLSVPVLSEGQIVKVKYTLEKKFDLWHGVPAYGFVSEDKKFPAILAFRPTNTVFTEKDTLPTMLSNIHPHGPAWNLFNESKFEIENWLKEKTKEGVKARVLGFSQGAVLGAYFLTYLSQYFNQDESNSSILCDGPGVNHLVEKAWDQLVEKPAVHTLVNRGDLIPKVGDAFIGKAFEIRVAQDLRGFDSHRALTLLSPQWKVVEISSNGEKKSTSRGVLTFAQRFIGGVFYEPIKSIALPVIRSVRV